MRNTLDDAKFKDLLKEDDRKKVDEAVKSCLKMDWRTSNCW